MGFHTEINTMLRLGKNDPARKQLSTGKRFIIKKSNIRIYPLDCAILLLTEDWTVLGYCAVRRAELKEAAMTIEFEVLSMFSAEESKIYTDRFQEVAAITREIAPRN